jgi:hypothetical protein
MEVTVDNPEDALNDQRRYPDRVVSWFGLCIPVIISTNTTSIKWYRMLAFHSTPDTFFLRRVFSSSSLPHFPLTDEIRCGGVV